MPGIIIILTTLSTTIIPAASPGKGRSFPDEEKSEEASGRLKRSGNRGREPKTHGPLSLKARRGV